ncbi:MAG: hypothetical protein RIR51_1709 [Bacteroidota bacterium]
MKKFLILILIHFYFEGFCQNSPENLGRGVNSEYLELNPVISPDGKTLYFGRKNHPNNSYGTKGSETIAGSQDIWYSILKENGEWGHAIRMNNTLNRDQYNTILSISPDGQTILLKGSYINGKYDSRGFSISTKTKSGWTIPQKIDIPSYGKMSKGLNEYAFLTNDGKKLILAFSEQKNSDRDDLYISFLGLNGKWSKPRNLGTKINTKYSETTPFLAADGRTLYFSSDRPGGKGSHDIYVSRRMGRDDWYNWSEPKNLGSPINTNKYDAYFSLAAEGNYAYFLSELNAYGQKDIFRIKFGDANKDLLNTALDSLLRNGLWDELKENNILDNSGNHNKMNELVNNNLIDQMIQKGLWDNLKEYGIDANNINNDNLLIGLKNGVLKNLINNNLLKDLERNKEVDVLAYEDEIKNEGGKIGSGQQADPVVLLSGKIKTKDGKELPEDIKVSYENLKTGEIIGYAKPDANTGIYKIVLPYGEKYGITVSSKGFVPSSINLDLSNLGGRYLELNDRDIDLIPIAKGSIARINNLFFEINKADLSPESSPELNRLVKLMEENRELKIEISGHTDNTGTKVFNEKLSIDRANAVGNYLKEHNIAQDRIFTKGFGWEKPVATNDTEEGRALNRRVEILIL